MGFEAAVLGLEMDELLGVGGLGGGEGGGELGEVQLGLFELFGFCGELLGFVAEGLG
jgi:hypothetical protein